MAFPHSGQPWDCGGVRSQTLQPGGCAVSPGQWRYDELTLEIPGNDHPGPGYTHRQENVLAPRGLAAGRMTPRWGRGQALPLAVGTQRQRRSLSGPLTPAERGHGEPSESCRVSDHPWAPQSGCGQTWGSWGTASAWSCWPGGEAGQDRGKVQPHPAAPKLLRANREKESG